MSEELSAIANERVSRRVNARERKEAERYDTYSDGLRVREGDDGSASFTASCLSVNPNFWRAEKNRRSKYPDGIIRTNFERAERARKGFVPPVPRDPFSIAPSRVNAIRQRRWRISSGVAFYDVFRPILHFLRKDETRSLWTS